MPEVVDVSPSAAPSLGPVLISAAEIQGRVEFLAGQILNDHPGGTIRLVVALKGAWVFAADLARAMQGRVEIDFLTAASYGSGTTSSGAVSVTGDESLDLAGQQVVVVEDIVDSGRTVQAVVGRLRKLRPASLRLATLLSKPSRRVIAVQVDYLGFEIADEFTVGYGMDWAEQFRHLPDIRTLRNIPREALPD